MATELTVQSERAFQKQPHIFLNQKSKAAKSKKIGKGGRRWYKDIGLGFKTPKEAINGSYIGTKFPPYIDELSEKPFVIHLSSLQLPQLGILCQRAVIDLRYATDKKCPFTGMVSIRGRILTGKVISTKMHRTLIIRREYLHFIPKYARYEKRHSNLAAHVSPAFRVEEGDTVTVGQCRPLSKTVSCLAFLRILRKRNQEGG
jgi:small subunit ribosomal protein S11e